jgi:AbrB family looped-hinge helix DNA binding protein
MEIVQVRKRFQITLPASVRQEIGLKEGDIVLVEARDGEIILRPQEVIDRSQVWYWSEAWQQAEQEAEADIAAGRTRSFETVDELIASLHQAVDDTDAEESH